MKYSQLGWSAARVEAVDTAQHGAGLGVDEHRSRPPGSRAVVHDVDLEARGESRHRWSSATSRTCWSSVEPADAQLPEAGSARRARTPPPASTPALRAAARARPPGRSGAASPCERAGPSPAWTTRSRRGRRRCRRRACRAATGSPPNLAAEAHDVGIRADEADVVDELEPGQVAEQRRVAAHELPRRGLGRAGAGPPRASRRACRRCAGRRSGPSSRGRRAAPRRRAAWPRAPSCRAGRSCPSRSRAHGSCPRRRPQRAPSALPQPPGPPSSTTSSRCAPSFDHP